MRIAGSVNTSEQVDMAKSQCRLLESPEPNHHSWNDKLREAWLMLLVVTSVFLLIALASYDVNDSGWSLVNSHELVNNQSGLMGAWLADLVFSFMGYLAYGIPVFMLWEAINTYRYRQTIMDGYRVVGMGMSILGIFLGCFSACALASLYDYSPDDSMPLGAGGILGLSILEFARPILGVAGSTLILSGMLLTALTLYLNLSWFWLIDKTCDSVAYLFKVSVRTFLRGFNLGSFWLLIQLQDFGHVLWLQLGVLSKKIASMLKPKNKIYDHSQSVREQVPPNLDLNHHMVDTTTLADPHFVPEKNYSERVQTVLPVMNNSSAGDDLSKLNADDMVFEPNDQSQVAVILPEETLLDSPNGASGKGYSHADIETLSVNLEERLKDFAIIVKVVAVHPGPVVTLFEVQPAPGIKVNKITNLAKDLARSLAVMSVRVVEIIPGKSVIGIEIPNQQREMVYFRELIESSSYKEEDQVLSLALGQDIGGTPVVANLAAMPHLLVAGTTGSGKSVGVNAMILSILYKATPDQVRMLMVDPKMLELSVYEGIPHLLAPVVTDMKKAANGLCWCVAEMERRYQLMAALGVRNLEGFNNKVAVAQDIGEPVYDPLQSDGLQPQPLTPLPYIIVVIDEFADMMMIVGKKVEESIARIAQKARAAGIHLILATQRPSVDVITGLIKANIPARISFLVSSKIDSRTILDQGGAEQLLGHGDMLYLAPGTSVPVRIHGAFVSDDEVHRVVADWKKKGVPQYMEDILSAQNAGVNSEGSQLGSMSGLEQDALYDEAVAFVLESRRASISAVQRKLKIGYNRAARMIEAMKAAGLVSEMESSGGREVLVPPQNAEV